METEKRKRKDDGASNDRRAKLREREGGAVKVAVPADEEVEEFFAILKRIQVAVKYFQERNSNADHPEMSAAPPPRWRPTFEREDFDGVKTEGNQSVGLDLNSDPGCDISDRAD